MSDEHRKSPSPLQPVEPHGHEHEEGVEGAKALEQALHISFGFLKLAMLGLIVVYLLSGLFVVGPDEVKIRLTFGRPKYVAGKVDVFDSESGWHIKWPWQEVVRVSTTERKLNIDKALWFHEQGKVPGQEEEQPQEEQGPGAGLDPVRDHYVITGDANILHMKMTAKYRVTPALAPDFVFGVDDPEGLLRETVLSAVVRVVGRMKVDDVLTVGRSQLIEDIVRETNDGLKQIEDATGHSAGVVVTGLTLDDLAVPQTVRQSFREADAARSEYYTKVRQAEAKERETIRRAEGEAVTVKSEAESERSRMVASARADAKRIGELADLYAKQPDTFRQRYYEQKVREVLAQAKQIWIMHTPKEGGQRRLWLYTGPTPPKERPKTGPGAAEAAGH